MYALGDKSSYSILIADDNPKNLSILENMLSGYRVRSSINGKKALASIKIEKPDIILLDVYMPEMDGFELCKILKADPDYREIPILFISALNETFSIVQALRIGGQDYIVKPFNLEEVLARVEVHLSLKKKNMELASTMKILKDNEAKFIHIEKLKSYGIIIAGITHELNNPLNYMKNSIGALQYDCNDLFEVLDRLFDSIKEDENYESIREALDMFRKLDYPQIRKNSSELFDAANTGIRKISEIVKTLKTFSRLNESEISYVDVNDNILSVLKRMEFEFDDNLKYETDLKTSRKIKCYPVKLNQMILSMLNNSIEAIKSSGGEKGCITIGTHDIEDNGMDFIRIIIKDTGSGIADNALKNMFDPFYTTKEFGKHLGLGLTLCNQITQELNGRIEYESMPGAGTSFFIYLPASDNLL